jgi:hypothetical protein
MNNLVVMGTCRFALVVNNRWARKLAITVRATISILEDGK